MSLRFDKLRRIGGRMKIIGMAVRGRCRTFLWSGLSALLSNVASIPGLHPGLV